MTDENGHKKHEEIPVLICVSSVFDLRLNTAFLKQEMQVEPRITLMAHG